MVSVTKCTVTAGIYSFYYFMLPRFFSAMRPGDANGSHKSTISNSTLSSLLSIHCTRGITCKLQGNCLWSLEITLSEKKGRNDDQRFLQKSKILYGSPYKNKKVNLSFFFFAQNGRPWSRDLICIFFYMELHNFSDSLFCSGFDVIGLNPQDIDHPSTFEEN